jgi:hypothetical protein
MVALGIVASRNGRSRNGRVRNGRSRIGTSTRWLRLVKVTLRRSFQQSSLLSVTLTLTFRSLSILENQFSKTLQRKPILRGKGDSRLSYSGIDEIPASHLTETEKSRKLNLITNL